MTASSFLLKYASRLLLCADLAVKLSLIAPRNTTWSIWTHKSGSSRANPNRNGRRKRYVIFVFFRGPAWRGFVVRQWLDGKARCVFRACADRQALHPLTRRQLQFLLDQLRPLFKLRIRHVEFRASERDGNAVAVVDFGQRDHAAVEGFVQALHVAQEARMIAEQVDRHHARRCR